MYGGSIADILYILSYIQSVYRGGGEIFPFPLLYFYNSLYYRASRNKLEFHGTDTDTDTDFSDALIV